MIRVLDSETVGQIAAGEVVERPLSVVKELVENAVDAGATRIGVRIEAGGLKAIEVSDDGAGIASTDLRLAVTRHATSKLAHAGELESVGTLGFRGEGLASIAAVSRTTILSRVKDAELGAVVQAHAETAGDVRVAAAPVGTNVRAEDLFANVPVRREYLRSPAAEFNRISGWLGTFALAYPQITFSLSHDGRAAWVLPASTDVRQRLAMVFGRSAAEGLMPLDTRAADSLRGSLEGWISKPGSDRPDRRMQILFVNGRLLRSSLLAGAWSAAYSSFAMSARHPYGVLFLRLPPEHVDPNVHPTKSDVRLRHGHQVFDAVRRAMGASLRDHASRRLGQSLGSELSLAPSPVGAAALSQLQSLFEASPSHDAEANSTQLRVLAQILRTYIVAADEEGIVLVDQHAAHERIAYERIASRAQRDAEGEPLLVPHVFELSAEQSAALDRTIDILREGGLEVEAFGDRSYRIVATPGGYGARPFDLGGFLDDLTQEPKQRDVRERVWASLACHSVVRAGEELDVREMITLVERLRGCENPMHCPHGRPTIVRLDGTAIAKLFKRI